MKITYFLTAILNPNLGESERYTSAVLLRRLFSKEFSSFYPNLPADAQKQIKEHLLLAVQQEQSEALRKKVNSGFCHLKNGFKGLQLLTFYTEKFTFEIYNEILSRRINKMYIFHLKTQVCDLVSEVAQNMVDKDGNIQWQEFLQFMYQCLSSNNSKLKDSCLRMFVALPRAFDSIQPTNTDLVKKIFENCLQRNPADPNSYDVNFQAVRALGTYLADYEDDVHVIKAMTCFLPQFMNVISESVEKQDDDALVKVLIEVAEKVPKFLKPLLNQVMKMNILVVANENYSLNFRQLALEVIVVLTEVQSVPVRKNCVKEITELIPYLLSKLKDFREIIKKLPVIRIIEINENLCYDFKRYDDCD